jgi:hypothetical protein
MTDLNALNVPLVDDRLAALAEIAQLRHKPAMPPDRSREVNCHVHTFYSFSPYSPSAAAERAQEAGLAAVGIMDHDSVSGAAEMRRAGELLGIATTTGVELRVSVEGTALAGRKINNPDSMGNLYMAIHGIPLQSIPAAQSFLKPLHAAREARDRRMVEALNGILPGYGLRTLDWEKDVRSSSRAGEGGSLTERHILFAVARVIVQTIGTGNPLLSYLKDTIGITAPGRLAGYLADPENDFLLFDLLGLLKSSFIGKVYIQPDAEECIPVERGVRVAEELGGISAYAYLGDVSDSPTGDKKAERFEDGYLDLLMEEVKRLGFRAITYMPPRNTMPQLRRLQGLCAKHGFMEISGVDINSPRQSFNCPELALPEFSHLMSATWALIAHERLSEAAPRYGLFHQSNPLAGRPLVERIAAYAEVGRTMDHCGGTPAVDHPLVGGWGR